MWRFLRPRAKRRWPSLPEGLRIYAIGDVHGRVDLLDTTFARIDANLARSSPHRAYTSFSAITSIGVPRLGKFWTASSSEAAFIA